MSWAIWSAIWARRSESVVPVLSGIQLVVICTASLEDPWASGCRRGRIHDLHDGVDVTAHLSASRRLTISARQMCT